MSESNKKVGWRIHTNLVFPNFFNEFVSVWAIQEGKKHFLLNHWEKNLFWPIKSFMLKPRKNHGKIGGNKIYLCSLWAFHSIFIFRFSQQSNESIMSKFIYCFIIFLFFKFFVLSVLPFKMQKRNTWKIFGILVALMKNELTKICNEQGIDVTNKIEDFIFIFLENQSTLQWCTMAYWNSMAGRVKLGVSVAIYCKYT